MARTDPSQSSAQRKKFLAQLDEKPTLAMMPFTPGGAGLGKAMAEGAEEAAPEGDYYNSAKGVKITPERAAQEVRNHGLDPSDFFKEVGQKSSYMAHHVLDWLGY